MIPLPTVRTAVLVLTLVGAFFAGSPLLAPHPGDASNGGSSLQRAFAAASREFGVPEPILLSVSYNLSRWEEHGGAPSTSGGYGPMHLTHVDRLIASDARGDGRLRVTHDPSLHTLDLAARILHRPLAVLEGDPTQNIRGGAALLARYADQTVGRRPQNPGEWYGAVAAYSGSRTAPVAQDFAAAVFRTVRQGQARTTTDGQYVALRPQAVSPDTHTVQRLHLRPLVAIKAACPRAITCQYVPAAYHVNNPGNPQDYGNYDVASRPKDGLAIRYIVIHDTEASYSSAVASFQNPTRYASANYVIRASDGLVTQMVPNQDIAWHAGNYYVNMHAIGIEHEGIAIQGATWYTEQFYQTSAALVRYLAHKYSIPLDRAHIVGHEDVPGPTPSEQSAQHWDPGPFWDWQHYMDLLGAPEPDGPPSALASGRTVLTIYPDFATNRPAVTYCQSAGSCGPVPAQSASFVYLRTAPDPHAPLLGDPALHSSLTAGTTQANDWGDKAPMGQQFVRVDRRGSWDAIDYAGQEVWFHDPAGNPTALAGGGRIVTPRGSSIPVYGRAYPEAGAYPSYIHHPEQLIPLQYTIPHGQWYVATDLVTTDFYWSPTQKQHAVVKGQSAYYQIFFNHRFAFVKASDVQVKTLKQPVTPTPTPSPTPSATLTPTPAVTPTEGVITVPTPVPTPASSPTPSAR